ncbi:MAG: carboxypeptidase-like regulatory domain-containing protein, partial [Bacteroidia bacterium]|nr:carboxypeptidase-like regulatory domain-containing protein [Bacteroidia bacterium]
MSTVKTFLLFFVLIFFKLNSQTIKGKITDETNNSAVPFAFVGIENNHKGTTADIDGNFQLKVDSSIKQLTVFITGYNKKTIVLADFDLSKPINIKLKPSDFLLNEVVVTPKENPAHELIRRLIKNKKNLDPR